MGMFDGVINTFYYIQSNEMWRIINEIKCIFRKSYIFTNENIKLIFSLLRAVKNIRSGTIFFLIFINGHYARVKI